MWIINIFNVLVQEEVVTKVFWTGATKSGCAGQFVDCFVDGGGMKQLNYEKRILTSESGGSSVGVFFSVNKFTAKTMPGETKMYFACQSSTRRSATYIKVQEVTRNFKHPSCVYLLMQLNIIQIYLSLCS